MNKICVYAICKNESQFVDKWVDSMKEADCIVVLDTGSTDDTVEKLKKYEPKVHVETKVITPWRFDTARNESLKLVPDDCNILICTDLDEVLEEGWSKPLREKWVEGKHERGVYKYSWSHLENGDSGRVFRYDKIHSRNWRWKYPVHELLYNDDRNSNNYSYDEVLDLFDEVHLHHYPDQTKSRGSYLPLLELRAEEDETDHYGLIYLAHEYFYRGFYQKSINTLNKVLDVHYNKCSQVEIASCYLFMGDSYKELNDFDNSISCYMKAISIDKTYREPYLNLAKVLINDKNPNKNYNGAILTIKEGLKNSYRHFTWLERDISWTYEPWDLLSLAEYYNGNKKDSLAHAIKALSYEDTNERLKSNVDIILKLSEDNELI